MSLKFFHIAFITLSSLLCFGFSLWCFNNFLGNPIEAAFKNDFGSLNLVMGIIAFILGIGLIVYGKRFLKKLKEMGY